MKPRGTLTLSCHLNVKDRAIMDLFAFKLKSSVGSSVCVYVWCVFMDSWWWNQILFIKVSVSGWELSLVFWKAATQTPKMTNNHWKTMRDAAEFSTPTSHVQYSHNKNATAPPVEALPFHHSSVVGGMMQKWCKCEASSATRWPSGRGLPILQWTMGAQRWCQLWEWERWAGGASRPVPAMGKSGLLAAWLSGWQGGCVVVSGITLHRCANSSSAQHLCPPPPLYHPSLSLDGRTHRCSQSSRAQRTAPCSLWSRIKITTGDSGWVGAGVQAFLRLGWGISKLHKTPPALPWRQVKRWKRCTLSQQIASLNIQTPFISLSLSLPILIIFFSNRWEELLHLISLWRAVKTD